MIVSRFKAGQTPVQYNARAMYYYNNTEDDPSMRSQQMELTSTDLGIFDLDNEDLKEQLQDMNSWAMEW